MLDAGERVQVIDARARSYLSRQQHIMDGATWRDPERIGALRDAGFGAPPPPRRRQRTPIA